MNIPLTSHVKPPDGSKTSLLIHSPSSSPVSRQSLVSHRSHAPSRTLPHHWFNMLPHTHSNASHSTVGTACTETVELITLAGNINNTSSTAILIDSGASCNFISASFATRAQIVPWNLAQKLQVKTASGHTMCCSLIAPSTPVKLPGYEGHHDFIIVSDLDTYDVVLGRTFLKHSHAFVDHDAGTVTWPTNIVKHHNNTPRTDSLISTNPWNAIAPDLDPSEELEPSCSNNTDPITSSRSLQLTTVDSMKHASCKRSPHKPTTSKARSTPTTNSASSHAATEPMKPSQSIATSATSTITHPSSCNSSPTASTNQRAVSSTRSAEPTTKTDTNQSALSYSVPVPKLSSAFAQLAISIQSAPVAAIAQRVEQYVERMQPNDGKLPPSRGQFDHKIELKDPDARPVKSRAIPLNAEERAQLAIDIKELLEAGLIERSESEWGSPAFYVSKDGGSARRLVVDYRALNKLLKRNTMTLPHVDELIARLGKAKYFTKIDLRSSYHQILVRPEDRHMTAFVTPIGHFQWRVLPFGEANAPATFVQMMRNLVLSDMTDRGVLDFVDDILVYSETAEQHVQDVSDVLDRLEKHELFIKPSKCQWMVQQVEFLGLTITATDAGTTVTPMHSKIDAVTSWPRPRTQTQLRSFTGFANTFTKFIDGFSGIAAPLFDLLKRLKGKRTAPLRWNERATAAFDELKHAIANSATLGVADASKPFIVHTDASDYAVGAVLSQHNERGELRPIGFVSQKLSDVEYRWSVYEKELYSIVVALKRWSMHLMYTQHPVEIHNDHASLRYLLDQPKLTAKQTRWLALLSTYSDLRFVHVKGSDNARADALSRRSDHDVGVAERQQIRSDIAKQQFLDTFSKLGLPNVRLNMLVAEVNAGKTDILNAIVEGYVTDARCSDILRDPERYGYRLRWDLLERSSDGSVLVPDNSKLRSRILQCVHDAPTSGHLGITKTFDRLIASYHWPNAWLDVAESVKSCEAYQRSKQRSGKVPGLHQPTEVVPKAHTIAIDFLGPINMTARGKDSVLVMMDVFTKHVFLEPVSTTITAQQTANFIINRIVRHQGLPRAIRSDRDARFTSEIWTEIWSKLGTDLHITTAHHHQSNGLPERFMQNLSSSIRTYCNERGTNWDQLLSTVEIAYNSSQHSVTGYSPFELDLGIAARLPINLSRPENETTTQASEILDRINSNEINAFRRILASQSYDKQRIDATRHEERYEIGDVAWLDTNDLFIMNQAGAKKLRARWAGPFKVLSVEGDLNVTLDLPSQWRIHPTIHIARLKRALDRDLNKFPIGNLDNHWFVDANEPSQVPIERDIVTDLSEYDECGAAVAEVEREAQLSNQVSRPRTRAAVQRAHDRGETYDYVKL